MGRQSGFHVCYTVSSSHLPGVIFKQKARGQTECIPLEAVLPVSQSCRQELPSEKPLQA